jgi:hypothetical protein
MRNFTLCAAILAGALLVALGSCRMPFCPTGEDPFVIIDKPPAPAGGDTQALGEVIIFGWRGGNERDPRSVRWMWSLVVDTNGVYNPVFDIVKDLNEHPERYEDKWSKWVPYSSPQGRTMTLGDDEALQMGRAHIFAVQAMDICGKTTAQFTRRTNVRQFIVSAVAGPLLTVAEPHLGANRFLGMSMNARSCEFPADLALNFTWRADASSYGGEIAGYRYGWDVADINNPNDWDVRFSLAHTSAPPMSFSSGIHTFFVEAMDNAGKITLGKMELRIVPFTMERNLLWVDDFPSTEFTQIDYAVPTESQHDAFWLDICGRAQGFDPAEDVWDAYYMHNARPPEFSRIRMYRNIIWSYGSSTDSGAWDDVIRFTPESMIGSNPTLVTNYLSMFLAKGGHLLTEGQADRSGGLAACLLPMAQSFPMNLRCEITGNQAGCDGDLSGVNTIAYRDYCVTMLDKVVGAFRRDADMPTRMVRVDCMTHAVRADDPVASALASLPDRLDLWEEITKPGRYFDPAAPAPRPGGFTFVEAYDPAYWMSRNSVTSQSCFHPMFRMRTRSSVSVLDNTAVALVLTKHENVAPPAPGAVAAKSFHFGFPLWYFNRQQVNRIISVVFTEWQIMAGM